MTKSKKFTILNFIENAAKQKRDAIRQKQVMVMKKLPVDIHDFETMITSGYLMLGASGVLVQTEVLTSRGRIDMEVYFPEKIYIVELRCNQPAEMAITQIREKKYFEKHLHSGKKILLLGINFSTQERRIVDWLLDKTIRY